MPIMSPRVDPDGVHPSPYRGWSWTAKSLPGQETMIIYDSNGAQMGVFNVRAEFALPDFEEMMEAWLNRHDPLKASERAPYLKRA